MKAIKERAHKYIEQAIVCGGTGGFSAYIAGAADQWTIDVEKACRWFADYFCGKTEYEKSGVARGISR